MSIAVPLALVSRRRDVAAALEGDPGAVRYAITIVDPGRLHEMAACSAVIVDGPGLDDAPAVARKIRRTHPTLEQLAIVADERAGVDAIRGGAHDFLVWPPAEAAALWTQLASLVERVGPPRRGSSGTIGGYTLLERLGSGGMADVFLAQRPGEDPLVLKCMRPEIAEEERYVAMFLEEARISQALSHPNIVRVYDAGGTKDELFLAMEYVPGRNLFEIGKTAGWRLPPRIACFIAAEVAAALEHAHGLVDTRGARLSLIHRDVNPPNVLLRDDGAVKLTDFGIAKTKHQHSRTTQGVLRGKLEYMSPEQVDALPLDARTDVFSLGTVLYLLLTGDHPFAGTTTLQVLQRIQQARCEPPSSVDASLPPALDAIVTKALARDRDARYASAGALETDLRAWIDEAGGCSRDDVAAFVRDAAALRSGVVPRGEGGRRRETVARFPGVATVLSPPRPAAIAEGTHSGEAGEPTVTAAAIAPSVEPTLSREVSKETDAPTSSRSSVPEAADDATALSRAPAIVREADRDTVSRPARRVEAKASPGWRAPAAVGSLVLLVLVVAAAGRFGDAPIAATPLPPTTFTPLAVTTPLRQTPPSPVAVVTPVRRETPATVRATAAAAPTPARTATPVPSRVAVATPRPLRKGTVSIWVTDGWAAVSIDGKSLGLNAPVIGLELPEGKHRVTLENPPLKMRKEYDVTIAPGEETRLNVSIRQ